MAMVKQSAGVAGATIGDRAFAVAAEHRLQQVGLLGLRRQAGAGPAALHVDDDQRQLGHHRQADRLALERDARAARAGQPERPAERRADGRADGGDLVLGLEGLTPKFLKRASSCRMSLAGVIG